MDLSTPLMLEDFESFSLDSGTFVAVAVSLLVSSSLGETLSVLIELLLGLASEAFSLEPDSV